MINVITVLVFIALVINLPTTIAVLKGIKYVPTDHNCQEDVNNVKMNIATLKCVMCFNVVVFVAILIMLQFL